MKSFVRSLVAGGSVALAAAIAAPARAQAPESANPASAPAPARAASEAGDVVALLDEALSQVTLRPEQTATLAKLGSDLDAKVAPVDQARRNLLAALGPQIAKGSVDVAALEPQLRAFLDASAAAAPALRDAIQKLHDTLDPAQRKELVAALGRALDERNAAAAPSATLEQWTRTLKLDERQQHVLGAILDAEAAGSRRMQGRIDRVLAAFAEPSFRIDEVLPKSDPRARAEQVASEIVEIAALVTHVLTPAQRTVAANAIEQRAAGGDVAESSAPLEDAASESSPLWTGGYRGYAGGYRGYRGFGRSTGWGYRSAHVYHRASGYGFGGGYASGFGGVYLF